MPIQSLDWRLDPVPKPLYKGEMLKSGKTSLGDGTLYESLKEVTQELYQFVSKVQRPNLNDHAWLAAARVRCQQLSYQVANFQTSLSTLEISLSPTLQELLKNLQCYLEACLRELENGPNARSLRQKLQSLSMTYEELVIQSQRLKKRILETTPYRSSRKDDFFHLKPSNYARNVFHVLMGTSCILLYQFILNYRQAMTILLSFLTLGGFLEIGRWLSPKFNQFLMKYVFRLIARPHEHNHVNSATYYIVAVTLITFFYPKPAVLIGLLILTFADPTAALAGKRWGVRKIWKDKSDVGSLAFFCVAVSTTLIYLSVWGSGLAVGSKILVAIAAALGGTLAELFSETLDDNLTIPLLCSGIASFWF